MSENKQVEAKPPGAKCCGSRRVFLWTSIAAFCISAGLIGRWALYQQANTPTDFAPLERQGLNAPNIRTPDVVTARMVELAQVGQDEMVYDLGCGDGRLVITAALKSGCRGVGYDINPERVAEATENARLQGVADRVTILEQDVFTVDLSQADVAFIYLLPWMMNKLLPQLQEMRPGSRIVTHDYWMDGVEPDLFDELPDADGQLHGIYLYTAPLKINPAMEAGKPPRPSAKAPTATPTDDAETPKGDADSNDA